HPLQTRRRPAGHHDHRRRYRQRGPRWPRTVRHRLTRQGKRRTVPRRQPRGRPDENRGGDPVRIALAEDSTLLREGIAQLLVAEGHAVTAAVGTAEELLVALADSLPDLVIVDVRMPPGYVDEGIRAALEIRSAYPGVSVLVLS